MVIKNPPKISPGLIFGGGGLIIGMIFVLRIRGLIFGGGGLIIGILRYAKKRRYTAGEVLDHIFADDDSNDENISDTSSSEDEGPIDENQNPIDDGGDVMDLSIEDPPILG